MVSARTNAAASAFDVAQVKGAAEEALGLTSSAAANALSASLREALAEDAAHIESRFSAETRSILLQHLLTPYSLVPLAAAACFIIAFALGVDVTRSYLVVGSSSGLGPAGLLVCAALLILAICCRIALILSRARRLRWEVNGRVVDALLEFERATGGGALRVNAAAPALTTHAGIVTGFDPTAWEALEFSSADGAQAKVAHTVAVYRDKTWSRIPAILLVKGDVVALLPKETHAQRTVDGNELGVRGGAKNEVFFGEPRVRVKGLDGVELGHRGPALPRSTSNITGLGAAPSSRLRPGALPSEAEQPPRGQLRRNASIGASLSSTQDKSSATESGAPNRSLPQPHFSAIDQPRSASVPPFGGALKPQTVLIDERRAERARERNIDVLTLCGDLRRFEVLETPAVIAFAQRRGLRAPIRPRPIFLTQFRSWSRLGGYLGAALVVSTLVAVVVRSVLSNTVPDAGPVSGDVNRVNTRVGSGGWVGLLGGLLVQLPVLAILVAPVGLSIFLSLLELLGTARLLAHHELSLVRERWKEWGKGVFMDLSRAAKAEKLVEHEINKNAARDEVPLAHLVADGGGVLPMSAVAAGRVVADDSLLRAAQSQRAAPLGALAVDVDVSSFQKAVVVFEKLSTKKAHSATCPVTPHVLTQYTPVVKHETACCDGKVFNRYEDSSGDEGEDLNDEESDDDEATAGGPSAALSGGGEGADDVAAVESLSVAIPRDAARGAGSQQRGLRVREDSDVQRRQRENEQRVAADMWGPQRRKRVGFNRLMKSIIGGRGALAVESAFSASALAAATTTLRRVRPDVAGVDANGTFIPVQYRCESAGTRSKAPPCHLCCCSRRLQRSASADGPLARRFDGPSFSNVASVLRISVPLERVFFYLARLVCFVPTRIPPDHAPAPALHGRVLRDDLIDVGFGLTPVATPLAASQVALRLGAVTVFAATDKETVCDPEPTVEAVMLLKGERESAVIDLHEDDTSPSGVRFEGQHWKRHMNSLKPLGLACALSAVRAPRTHAGLAQLNKESIARATALRTREEKKAEVTAALEAAAAATAPCTPSHPPVTLTAQQHPPSLGFVVPAVIADSSAAPSLLSSPSATSLYSSPAASSFVRSSDAFEFAEGPVSTPHTTPVTTLRVSAHRGPSPVTAAPAADLSPSDSSRTTSPSSTDDDDTSSEATSQSTPSLSAHLDVGRTASTHASETAASRVQRAAQHFSRQRGSATPDGQAAETRRALRAARSADQRKASSSDSSAAISRKASVASLDDGVGATGFATGDDAIEPFDSASADAARMQRRRRRRRRRLAAGRLAPDSTPHPRTSNATPSTPGSPNPLRRSARGVDSACVSDLSDSAVGTREVADEFGERASDGGYASGGARSEYSVGRNSADDGARVDEQGSSAPAETLSRGFRSDSVTGVVQESTGEGALATEARPSRKERARRRRMKKRRQARNTYKYQDARAEEASDEEFTNLDSDDDEDDAVNLDGRPAAPLMRARSIVGDSDDDASTSSSDDDEGDEKRGALEGGFLDEDEDDEEDDDEEIEHDDDDDDEDGA